MNEDDGLAARLNRDCRCETVDPRRLEAALGLDQPGSEGLASLLATHPHLFSSTVVFAAPEHLQRMADVVAAVERVVALPAWQERVLGPFDAACRVPAKTRGMFLGYDFHLGDRGPQLIEINTNAGGALLNVALRRAQVDCCGALSALKGRDEDIAATFVDMLREEWRAARGDVPTGTVAIVDDDPHSQFLHPEFLQFAELFRAHGIAARIVDAKDLVVAGGVLHDGIGCIDFVYNRLTDFDLSEPAHAALAQAWREDLAVVSPHPRVYALYADKRNLVTLCDGAALAALGADEATVAALRDGIPRTIAVTPEAATELWAGRRKWFFKPATGYGSKAAYRGDKLTRGKWEEILSTGGYVAQALVPPGERQVLVDGEARAMKVDIRNFAYGGRVQLVCARLYQGQTTNFRTPGGGFAPVFPASMPGQPGIPVPAISP